MLANLHVVSPFLFSFVSGFGGERMRELVW